MALRVLLRGSVETAPIQSVGEALACATGDNAYHQKRDILGAS